jgi:competence protein ComEC
VFRKLFFIGVICAFGAQLWAGKLEIRILDVGQADAIFIRCPHGNHELLIDSGDTRYPGSSKNFKSALKLLQDPGNPLECVIASHPHQDHIGNMKWVIQNYKVGNYYDNGFKGGATWSAIAAALKQKGVKYWKSSQGSQAPQISFCPDVKTEILRPQGFEDESDDPNSRSVVLRMEYGHNSFLFTGDCEVEEEDLLSEDPKTRAKLDVDFLKAGHHGSDTSSSPEFLKETSPAIFAISCGAKGKGTNQGYKHPRLSVLNSFESLAGKREGPAELVKGYDSDEEKWRQVTLDKAVYVTTSEGELYFESDGSSIHRISDSKLASSGPR